MRRVLVEFDRPAVGAQPLRAESCAGGEPVSASCQPPLGESGLVEIVATLKQVVCVKG